VSSHEHDHAACLQAREEAAVSLLSNRRPTPTLRAHLEACPPCHEEYLELAALPPLLEGARELRGVAPDVPPSPLLLERLLAHVDRRRRRRRVTGGLVLLGAAVVLAAIPLAHRTGGTDPAPPTAAGSTAPTSPSHSSIPGEVVAMGAARAASGASAEVWVRARGPEGSTVSVAVHGLQRGTPCRMMVYDRSGGYVDGGVWTVTSSEASYTEEVDTQPTQIDRVELWDDGAGTQILRLPLRTA
jgi:hypothetical protein